MLLDYINASQPALGLTEAALMPAMPRMRRPIESPRVAQAPESHFVPVGQFIETPQETVHSQRRGSVAGRAVLGARGIHLPGASPMRPMGGREVTLSQQPRRGTSTYPIEAVIQQVRWA